MSKTSSTSGSCLCGAVTLVTTKQCDEFSACHCGMCRTWGGGPFLAVDCGQDLEIEGEESISVFDSSPWAERGFCRRCGTHLFYRIKGSQEYQVPVGVFGDAVSPAFRLQVFIDRKPEYYSLVGETETMTEAQIYEKYAPKE